MKSQSTIRRFDSEERFKNCISSKEAGSPPASFVLDKDSMEKFEIQPVVSSAISDVAIFLHNWHAAEGRGSWVYRVTDDESAGVERRLRWLLLENPSASITPHYGFCIRNHHGFIVGVILSFPGSFLSGERRLVGLCSGSFFVEPQARAQGFFLFKKYLSSPGYDFFFGTTCNANSGALWKKLRGAPLEGSDAEYILPINLDVMFPAVLSTPNRIAEQAGRLVGKCTNPVAHTILKRQSTELAVEPCWDWEKLSDLSRRHRPADLITTERSVAFLTWRYGKRSPNQSSEIYLFHDKIGNEGWFALGEMTRGRRGQIRGSVLLDAVWPRQKLDFGDIVPAIIHRSTSYADAIFFSPRLGIDFRKCSRYIVRRKLEGPRCFAVAPRNSAPLDFSSLDLVAADGDSGFVI